MRPWTSAELEALRILAPVLGGRGCAEAFDRSHSAIKQKASELDVSLRRPKGRQTDFRPLAGPTVLSAGSASSPRPNCAPPAASASSA